MNIPADNIKAFLPRMRLRHSKNKRIITILETRVDGAYVSDPLVVKRSKTRFISNRVLREDYDYVDMMGVA